MLHCWTRRARPTRFPNDAMEFLPFLRGGSARPNQAAFRQTRDVARCSGWGNDVEPLHWYRIACRASSVQVGDDPASGFRTSAVHADAAKVSVVNSGWRRGNKSVPPRHKLLVRLPILLVPGHASHRNIVSTLSHLRRVRLVGWKRKAAAVPSHSLVRACLVVTSLTVDEEYSKVDRVEVRQRGREAARQAPRPRHDPVSEAVYARNRQLSSHSGPGEYRRTSSGGANVPTSRT